MNGMIDKSAEFWYWVSNTLQLPNFDIKITDIIEVIIISFLIYNVLIWIKHTRAWNLFKGILVILIFIMVASILRMNTILWLAQNLISVGMIALVVVFQPELRRALENLGRKKYFGSFFEFTKEEEGKFSDRTIDELVKASYAMGRVKTGALIVIEDSIGLEEYIRTGIDVDGIVTNQLLINIFEKNTPLHDGAVVVRGDRIVSATCYLPLSDSLNLSKDLGTRHRAAVGISEISDSLTIIVSEETGKVSVAYKGEIHHDIDSETLRDKIKLLQHAVTETGRIEQLKRRFKNGKKNSKDLNK